MRAAISGWGTALPEQRLTNADLEQRVDTTDQWIVERTGIRERRIAGEGETTASLATEAGAAAIKHAGLTPDAIDLLIVATATTEQLIPHTGAFVGDGLGIRCGSFDLNAGCAGLRLRAGGRLVAAHRRQPRPRAHDRHPRRCRASPTRTTAARASSSATALQQWCSAPRRTTGPGSSPGTSAATAPRPGCSRSPPAESPADDAPRPSPTASTTCKMAGQEVFRRAVRIVVESATAALDRAGVDRRRRHVVRAAPGQHPYHRGRRQSARDPGGAHPREHRPLREHQRGVDPARPRRSRRRRSARRRATSCCCPASAPGSPGAARCCAGAARDRVRNPARGSRSSPAHRAGSDARSRVALGGRRVTGSRSATRPTTRAPRRPRRRSRPAGGEAFAVQADVADAESVDHAFTEIEGALRAGRAAGQQRRHHPRRAADAHVRRPLGRRCCRPTSPAPSTPSAGRRPR